MSNLLVSTEMLLSGQQAFACASCGKSFQHRHQLKPYACTEDGCDYKASLQADLTRHQRTKHDSQMQENKLFCPVPDCKFSEGRERWFTRSDTKARHVKKHKLVVDQDDPSMTSLISPPPTSTFDSLASVGPSKSQRSRSRSVLRLMTLQADGNVVLTQFENAIPPYVILSHTWGPVDQEVTFEDILAGTGKTKLGYQKIRFCQDQAAKDGLDYFWIDSCCIDKTNTVELSMAINSMFHWYHNAAKCYAYLTDFTAGPSLRSDYLTELSKSRWFRRGWTLQELIAPKSVEFFSQNGVRIGDKSSLIKEISQMTRIPTEALRGDYQLAHFGVEERLSWADQRQTTREEDIAYSLLGIFDVSLIPCYGEGKAKAIQRLREQIHKTQHNDDFHDHDHVEGVHASKRHKINQQESMLSAERTSLLLKSLCFKQIESRARTFRRPYAKTCEWILQNSQYTEWLDSREESNHARLLWIKGTPGCGKSTLMKYLHSTESRKGTTDRAVLSFFFNSRGSNLERSANGAYRTLLIQLFEQIPPLQKILQSLGSSVWRIGTEHNWDLESLKALLCEAICTLNSTSVLCFIDALDECDEQDVRDMVSFLEYLCEYPLQKGASFQICLASRHYPHISVKAGQFLHLDKEEGHNSDVLTYIENNLKVGHSKPADQIRAEVVSKALGCFLWVVLVVDILNKEYDSGRAHMLREELGGIPLDFFQFLRDVLACDPETSDELVLCLQWVLFARRPLNSYELYAAILAGTTWGSPEPFESELIESGVVEKYILNASKGMVVTYKLPTVQFFHECVRTFLLEEDGFRLIQPDLDHNMSGCSHETLKKICLEYIAEVDLTMHIGLSSTLPIAYSSEAKVLRNSITKSYPFLEYATANVLYHAEMARKDGIAQGKFLTDFSLAKWTRINNILDEYQFRTYSPGVTMLYVLAEHNMPNLIHALSSKASYLAEEKERYKTPLLAAFANDSADAVCVFLGTDQTGIEDATEMLRMWLQFMWDVSLRRESHQLLHGHEQVMKLLLDKGANVNTNIPYHGNALHLASLEGHLQLVKLLLEKGADVNAQGGEFDCALQAAMVKGHVEVVQLLRDHGALNYADGRSILCGTSNGDTHSDANTASVGDADFEQHLQHAV